MSFVTGSHAYGTPSESSDVDLVLQLTESEIEILKKADPQYRSNIEMGFSFKLGKMNLIVFPWGDDGLDQYGKWWRMTWDLILRAPVTREEAIEHFKKNGVGWDR